MNIIKVKANEEMDALYTCSALTIEGLAEESIGDFVEWIKQYTQFKNENVYIVKGKQMNEYYHLTGKNSYKARLTIVSVKLTDLEEPMNLAIPRFSVGARWFDDIVDNNIGREEEV